MNKQQNITVFVHKFVSPFTVLNVSLHFGRCSIAIFLLVPIFFRQTDVVFLHSIKESVGK